MSAYDEKRAACAGLCLDEMARVIEGACSAPAAKEHIVGMGYPRDMVDAEWKRLSLEIYGSLKRKAGKDGDKKQD